MPYTPFNRPQTDFKGGIQILADSDFKYTEEGGTIDAASVGERYVACGEPFIRNMTTGLYEAFTDAAHIDATTGAIVAGFADPVICDVDFNSDGEHNVIVGQLLIRGSVYDAKLPDAVTDAFRTVTRPLIRYVVRGV